VISPSSAASRSSRIIVSISSQGRTRSRPYRPVMMNSRGETTASTVSVMTPTGKDGIRRTALGSGGLLEIDGRR
jgi:hypothetical protein